MQLGIRRRSSALNGISFFNQVSVKKLEWQWVEIKICSRAKKINFPSSTQRNVPAWPDPKRLKIIQLNKRPATVLCLQSQKVMLRPHRYSLPPLSPAKDLVHLASWEQLLARVLTPNHAGTACQSMQLGTDRKHSSKVLLSTHMYAHRAVFQPEC